MGNKILLLFLLIGFLGLIGFKLNKPIQLDGVISTTEWNNAEIKNLKDSGSVYLKREQKILYVALTGNNKGWAHVYLVNKDTIRVLHASAALGEARYVKQKNFWYSVKSFNYELRDKLYNETTVRKQNDYYELNGWTANNNNLGNGMILEYIIDLSRSGNSPWAIAFVYLSDAKQPHYYPIDLEDDTILEGLVYGNTPDSLHFNSATWYQLK